MSAHTVNDPNSSIRGHDLYREIFRHSNDPIAIIDLNGFYLEQNTAHAKLLGYSDAELTNETPALHLGADVFAAIARELKETGRYQGEVSSTHRDGDVRRIQLSAFTMRDETGEPFCYVGIKHDITERKQSEEALRRSEAELTDFFENAAIGLHWVGPDGTVLRVNQAELDMLGYTREEFVGHNIGDFHADAHVIADIMKRLLAGEVIQNYEARLRCKDGRIKHVRIDSSSYLENGAFVHTRCFTRDISERKRAEGRLSLQYSVARILSESTDIEGSSKRILRAMCETLDWELGILWRVEPDAEVLRFVDICHNRLETPEFEAMSRNFEFKKGVGLPGRVWETSQPSWIDNITEDNNFPRAPVALREQLRGGFGFPIVSSSTVLGVMEFFSSEIKEPDDQLMDVANSIVGQIDQFIKRYQAEGERARLLQSERAVRAEAEKANRLKDEFLATLSHELRTPLNAVIGWSRMLSSGRLDRENSKHALEVIERNAWAQKQIIEDILDVSRVITGKLQLNMTQVDLVVVVDAALDAVRPAMEAKEIHIETIIDAGLRIISGDADRLQQVIWNVLSNAAKFTPKGGRVEITVNQTQTHVFVQVKDNGPGIEPAFLPYVFERFRQADGSTTRTHGGLGLGLAIVRHLVELHGGTITVENRSDGCGAIFTVWLPLPSGELNRETLVHADSAFRNERVRATLDGLHILVVDDETDALDLISVELTQHGAKVTAVNSAKDALNALEEADIDLLVSDIGMPKVDGYELIKTIRRNEHGKHRRIPAVALTAYARVQDRMQALLAGFSTHVAKPVEASELVTVVAGLAGRLDKN